MKSHFFLICLCLGLCCLSTVPCQARKGEDWYQRGVFFNRIRQYDKAFAAFSEAVKINPDHALAYNNRGSILYFKGQLDGAIKDYTLALKLEPGAIIFLMNRGTAWLDRGDYEKSILDFTRVISLDSGSDMAFNKRGMARFHTADYSMAIEDFTKAIQLNPGMADYYNNRGSARSQKGYDEMAVSDYTRALEIRPSLAYLQNRGGAWSAMELPDRAIQDYTRALALNSASPALFVLRGSVHYTLNEFEKAREDFSRALEINPQNPSALNQLAWMLCVCPDRAYRDGPRALALAQTAVDLFPGTVTYSTLAAAHAENKNFEAAVRVQQLSIRAAEKSGADIPQGLEDRLKGYVSKTEWRTALRPSPDRNGGYPKEKHIGGGPGNFRLEPSRTSLSIATVKKDQTITVLGRHHQWFLSELSDGQLGWIHETLFKPASPKIGLSRPDRNKGEPAALKTYGEIIVAIGRIRALPRADAKVKYKVVEGNRLLILQEKGHWYKVFLGKDKTGWAHKSLFRL